MKKQKNIIIIPARGGSKRLPKKNILPLNGKPLIQYTIDFAKTHSEFCNSIIVSTDDIEIKKIAIKNSVQVLNRPLHLAGDLVPTIDVLKDILHSIEEDFDNVILLQVTNPLRPDDLLIKAYKTYIEGSYDSLMTVSRNHQKFGKIIDGKFQPFNYIFGQRSQDLDPLYFENGLLYISKTANIKEGKILGNNNHPYIVNHPYAEIDIDSQHDLDKANLLIQFFNNKE